MKLDGISLDATSVQPEHILARHLTDGIVTIQIGTLTIDLTDGQADLLRGRLGHALYPMVALGGFVDGRTGQPKAAS